MARKFTAPIVISVLIANYGIATSVTAGASSYSSQRESADIPTLESTNTRYHRLRKSLLAYRNIAKKGGWPVLPKARLLRRGSYGSEVKILRRRLAATGDLKFENSGSFQFDADLDLAVRNFQSRHGLAVDGIVGPKTRAALNVPVNRRIEQLRINLERRRALPDVLGAHYIFVNMADYVLKVVKEERTVLTMRIVVGTPYRQTPIFSAAMTYIDFNPFWNIPNRIAREEIVPRVRQDVNYLAKQGIRVFSGWGAQAIELPKDQIDWRSIDQSHFPYRLRQDPGPLNPLGHVKFMFPNPHEIYLHDTPAKKLFAANIRAFSHGCIRLEQPELLAVHLLPGLPNHEIGRIIRAKTRRVIHLPKPIPVHLAYLTAWVNKNGTVHFRKDIYKRDRIQTAKMGRQRLSAI